MIIHSPVKVQQMILESPLNESRHFQPYRWNTAICTNEPEYLDTPLVYPSHPDTTMEKPTDEILEEWFYDDGPSGNKYYLAPFKMSDFGLTGTKVSTDFCSDTHGNYYLDPESVETYSLTEDLFESVKPLFIERVADGTYHLNDGYALLAELDRRGYTDTVWAVVSDYTPL